VPAFVSSAGAIIGILGAYFLSADLSYGLLLYVFLVSPLMSDWWCKTWDTPLLIEMALLTEVMPETKMGRLMESVAAE
jgi:hypothetical protein